MNKSQLFFRRYVSIKKTKISNTSTRFSCTLYLHNDSDFTFPQAVAQEEGKATYDSLWGSDVFSGQVSPSRAKNWRGKGPFPAPVCCSLLFLFEAFLNNKCKIRFEYKKLDDHPSAGLCIIKEARPRKDVNYLSSPRICDGSQRSHIKVICDLWAKGTASINSAAEWEDLTRWSVTSHLAGKASFYTQIFHAGRTCPLC